MRLFRALLPLLSLCIFLSTLSFGAAADRIAAQVDSSQMVQLPRGVSLQARPEFDLGTVDSSFQLNHITLLTQPTPTQSKALAQLLAQQQDPKSPNYHKWLTPQQYAERFGLSGNDIQRITNWLNAEGFTVTYVANGRNWIDFSGSAAQVQSTLRTQIHRYNINGEMHFANSTPPSIPAALSGIVTGFRGLDDFRPKAMGIHRSRGPRSKYYASNVNTDLIAPGDIETIYGLTSLYNAGINGTGQKLVVAGQTDVYLADIVDFRGGFGFTPAISCTTNGSGVITACSDPHFQYVLHGVDPGITPDDLEEADLDLEWSGAVVPDAQIIFVNSNNAFTSYLYAIDQNLAPVISLSYGTCELLETGSGYLNSDESALQQGNVQGITIVNSSGDTGVAECDANGSTIAVQGLALSYPASSPEVTGVGGTAIPLSEFTGTYWATPTSNPTNGGTALSYIPETAWNDDAEIATLCAEATDQGTKDFCSQGGASPVSGWVPITSASTAQSDIGISASGGGVSNCTALSNAGECTGGFSQPSWQTVTISGQSAGRFSPDVALLASANFPGYIFCTPLSELENTESTTSSCASGIATAVSDESIIGGTSASAPVFAGIVTLINEYTGSSGLGNVNPMLYQLAATAPTAFNDVTSGSNIVYCTGSTPSGQPTSIECPSSGSFGYSAGTGYDLVTGLGSVNADVLAAAFKTPPDFTTSGLASSLTISAGQSAQTNITITPSNGFNQTVTLTCAGSVAGETCSFNPSTVTPNGSAVSSTLTVDTLATMATGGSAVSVAATAGVLSQRIRQSAVSVNVTATDQSFTITPGVSSVSVVQGQPAAVNFTITPDPTNGFNGTLVFSNSSCSGLPSEATCNFSPQSVVLSGTASASLSLSLATTAPVSELRPPFAGGGKIFYAALLPGVFGIVFAAGFGKRGARGLRFLSLILALGFSTLWLSGCSNGASSSNNNPGTPAGTYPVTVTATTGGSNPITQTAQFQLVVTAR